jgi:hypothetical protein
MTPSACTHSHPAALRSYTDRAPKPPPRQAIRPLNGLRRGTSR